MKKMRKIKFYRRFLVTVLIIGVVSISCGIPLWNTDWEKKSIASSTPIIPVKVTENLEVIITATPQPREEFTYQATESQLTSMINDTIEVNPSIGITDPHVTLENDMVNFRGQVQQQGINIPLEVQLSLYSDADHQIKYEIVSAKLGPIPLLNAGRNQISFFINQWMTGISELNREDVVYEEVEVGSGVIIVRGYVR